MKVKCPSCNKKTEISKTDMSCQKCGYTITKNDIKSILSKKYNYYDDYYEFSDKNASLTEILCLTFGFLGLHRLYLGKYFSGLIMFIWGSIDIIFGYFNFPYSFLLTIAQYTWIIIDLFLAYYGIILDGKGKPLEMDKPLNANPLVILFFLLLAVVIILLIYVLFNRLFIIQLIAFIIASIVYLVKVIISK